MSLADREFVFHIGAPKAGSTSLQHQVFPAVSSHQVHYHRGESRRVARQILRQAVTPAPFRSIDQLRENVATILQGVRQPRILISDERLLGASNHGFWDLAAILDVIGSAFSGFKVVLLIRRQDSWAESLYLQSLHEYWSLSKADFFIFPDQAPVDTFSHWWPQLDTRTLDLFGLFETLVAYIPRENVLVLPFEQVFAVDRDINPLADFLGLPSGSLPPPTVESRNQSYSAASASLARILNPLVRHPYRKGGLIPNKPFQKQIMRSRLPEHMQSLLGDLSGRLTLRHFLQSVVNPLFPRRARVLSDEEKTAILECHAARNRLLANELGLDLQNYGYF